MQSIDNPVANTPIGMLMKRFINRIELAKLNYYKRNPLEREGFKLVRNIYRTEHGTVLFDPGELLNIWEQTRVMKDHGGIFAEVGVFRGASAKIICEAKCDTPLHLFDTFTGLPDQISKSDGRFTKGLFAAS